MKPSLPTKIVFGTTLAAGLFFFSRVNAEARTLDTFVAKVKTTFFVSSSTKNEALQTSHKSTILVPSVATQEEDVSAPILEVKSGPMRLSTEEIDYPLEDSITIYEVKSGDTLASVAKLFGVTINTILWANNISNKSIKEGDVLTILPITGIKYTAKTGDTLASIAKKYKGDIFEIAKYNGISEDSALALGQEIIVPEGEVEALKPRLVTTSSKKSIKKIITAPLGFFVKPLAWFVKTQGIHGKNAVDLAAKVGTPVVATASGKVIVSKFGGYNGGYGNMIVIAHKNNIQTLYAHLSAINVPIGSTVEQGQIIGAVGSTGKSTGSHLHIEVRGAANPF